ncbi:MAG: hypothetical protein BJG00_014900 [Limnothrix sp. CACIAM 69d]|nr:MAG: hypothetical protein BJG00_014900 [Limnothrix sp. CACIAM 69d]
MAQPVLIGRSEAHLTQAGDKPPTGRQQAGHKPWSGNWLGQMAWEMGRARLGSNSAKNWQKKGESLRTLPVIRVHLLSTV